MVDADYGSYRIVSRRAAIASMFLIGCLGGITVWFGLSWVELYSDQISGLIESNPDQARVKTIRDLRVLAVGIGVSMCALAALIFRYGIKGLRTQSMPPRGSWVIEGQRVRTGPDAEFYAKLLLVMSVLLFLLGIVSTTLLWVVSTSIQASQ